MSRHERSNPDGRDTLKLTKWELENLHLPPVTTVTLYEGAGGPDPVPTPSLSNDFREKPVAHF